MTTIKKFKDQHVFYKLYEFSAIYDAAYKNPEAAKKIENENGSHKEVVKKVYLILNDNEYAGADKFVLENFSHRFSYDYKLAEEIYFLDYVKKCDVCGDLAEEIFVVELFIRNENFCSEECLRQRYSKERYNELYEQDSAYFTKMY